MLDLKFIIYKSKDDNSLIYEAKLNKTQYLTFPENNPSDIIVENLSLAEFTDLYEKIGELDYDKEID